MKFFVVAALLLAALVAAEPFNCTGVVQDYKRGKAFEYDLSSLYHSPEFSDSLFYQFPNDPLHPNVYVNLCGKTTTQCSPSSPVCKVSSLWNTVGYGQLETQEFVLVEKEGVESGKGVTIHYSNGEYCPSTGYTKSTIHVVCGTSETITTASVDSDGCGIEITISSAAGCGKEVAFEGTSAGETAAIVILVLLLVGVILYIAIGMFVNWKFKGASSVVEMIPQREFWMSVPGMVVDGCKFIAHGFKKGDYVSV